MAKQMLIDATRGKQTAMPPWLPYAGVHCAALIDQPADAFLKDAELLANGVVTRLNFIRRTGFPCCLTFPWKPKAWAARPHTGMTMCHRS